MARTQLSAYKRNLVYQMLNGHCAYCGNVLDKLNFHADHIVSYNKTSDNSLSNLLPSCPSCNMIKGCRSIEEFREYIPYKILDGTQGYLLSTYYKFKPRKIKFYFEKLGKEITNG